MNLPKHFLILACTALIAINSSPGNAAGLNYDLLNSTPIGSWQVREDTSTDHKGRQTITVMRSSMLGKETRDGEPHYWIEMVIDTAKISKKGKRKPSGDQMVMKALLPKSVLSGDPANVLTNLRGFGTEIIMQTGNEKPMRIVGGGGFMAGMMKAMGTEVNYDFEPLGNETVNVPAGEFNTRKIQGSGTTESKVMFKKISVSSDNTTWMSDNVPFGVVKAEGTTVVNGKQSTNITVLQEFGMSGATSLITQEPQEMPSMDNIFGQ